MSGSELLTLAFRLKCEKTGYLNEVSVTEEQLLKAEETGEQILVEGSRFKGCWTYFPTGTLNKEVFAKHFQHNVPEGQMELMMQRPMATMPIHQKFADLFTAKVGGEYQKKFDITTMLRLTFKKFDNGKQGRVFVKYTNEFFGKQATMYGEPVMAAVVVSGCCYKTVMWSIYLVSLLLKELSSMETIKRQWGKKDYKYNSLNFPREEVYKIFNLEEFWYLRSEDYECY